MSVMQLTGGGGWSAAVGGDCAAAGAVPTPIAVEAVRNSVPRIVPGRAARMRVIVVDAMRILRKRELTRIRSEPARWIARAMRRIVTCTIKGTVSPAMAQNGGSPCPSRSRLGTADDGSSEYDQVAHVEPLLRRTEPGHPDAASAPALRRRNALYRRSDGPDLDARTDHACIIGISTAGRIVPRCQPSATLVPKPTGTTVQWGRVQVDADEHGDPEDLAGEARRRHQAAQVRGSVVRNGHCEAGPGCCM